MFGLVNKERDLLEANLAGSLRPYYVKSIKDGSAGLSSYNKERAGIWTTGRILLLTGEVLFVSIWIILLVIYRRPSPGWKKTTDLLHSTLIGFVFLVYRMLPPFNDA